ncbi:MAG: AAC(3) family N-acetyltransferase [Candidatus Sericytochromatia bacterium]|nr:AAC(3) family N-acetyltransferase [Candidatus Sericytochromatia bacterium]
MSLPEQQSSEPITVSRLVADLRMLGVQAGDTLLLHSSLSALGWVCGGGVAVIEALQTVLTPAGTLMMPAHSGDLSDPAQWENPPVPAAWWPIIRQEMPAYRPDLTPTLGIGVIPELFRAQRGVRRSAHPSGSFCAWGRQAEAMTAEHALDNCFGEGSPLARLYDLGGHVLQLGVSHDSNTSLHLAEVRAGRCQPKSAAAPLWRDGQRVWQSYADLDYDNGDFEAVGQAFEAACPELLRQGQVGQAQCRYYPQRPLVDFATRWFASALQQAP